MDRNGIENADACYFEGQFEVLNNHSKKLKFMDVRDYARMITETTGDEKMDLERYFEVMPLDKKEAI